LPGPVVIPQASPGPGQPFTRAYAPILAEHGVPMQAFVELIDNFNIVSNSSPPLQILDLASGAISFVPIPHARLVGYGVSAAIKVGEGVVSKSRGGMFIKKVNLEFFNPRGLRIELATSKALKAKLGMDPEVPLAAPIAASNDMSSVQRRMASLQGRVAPLTFDVPLPSKPTKFLDRLCLMQQRKNAERQERKAQESRLDYASKSAEIEKKLLEERSKHGEELQKLNVERQKLEHERDKEMQKAQRERKPEKRAERETEAMADFRKEMRKLDEEYDKIRGKHDEEVRHHEGDRRKEDKEGRQGDKIQWMLIE
ncbi:hypothetical protein BAUCODRAFT_57983, partial [Baudoinia panamericana UAMH 10762]